MAAKHKRSGPGDCVVSIALREGFRIDDVWRLPANEHLRSDPARDAPEIVASGQKVFLPERSERAEPGPCDQKHKFRRSEIPVFLRVRLLDFGKPRANKDYLFKVEGEQRKGRTGDDGLVEEEIPFDATEARLLLTGDDQGEEFIFKVGYLEPASKVAGAQARLHNLGYNTGPIDNLMGPITERALKIFQRDQELEQTGELDDPTIDALVQAHGC